MNIGRQCQVLRCPREANTVFQVTGPGHIIETVVCDPHDVELKGTTGWVYDADLARIRMGVDAPATPTGWRAGDFQDDGETFTILYTQGDDEPREFEMRLSEEARVSFIRALRGTP